MREEKMRTIKDLSQEVLRIQDEGNIVVLSTMFQRAMEDLYFLIPSDKIKRHFITRCWIAKLHNDANYNECDTTYMLSSCFQDAKEAIENP